MDRQLFVQGSIILAVTVGSWMVLVEPVVTDIRELEEEIVAAQGETASLQSVHQSAIARLPQVRERLAEIRRDNAIVDDTVMLSEAMWRLADDAGVTVQGFDPGGWGLGSGKRAVQVNEVTMLVEGEYRQIAEFLAAVCEMNDSIRPKSLELTPQERDGSRLVLASVALETLQFRIKDDLARMETDDGQP